MRKLWATVLSMSQCLLSVTGCTRGAKSNSSPVTLLPAAVAAVQEVAAASGVTTKYWVRLEVHLPGGPETLRHTLDIETDPLRVQDREFTSNGMPVVVLAHQVEMLKGCTVDFGEKDGRKGFKIRNPNFEGDDIEKWLQELVRHRGQ